jgi:mRNA-degrading endonuclease RelE of RelBE toxin-antitoxin system
MPKHLSTAVCEPDGALELRDNLAEFLRIMLAEIEAGTSEVVSVESIAAGHGMNWQPTDCEVRFISLAQQILARRENTPIAQSILDALNELAVNFDHVQAEPLAGPWPDVYRLRVGERRVIYAADRKGRRLTIYLIGHWREDLSQRK